MTDDLHGFAEWRDNIESRVGRLEVTGETEARVKAQMDQDMSDLKLEFRAQRGLLEALRETQSDHTATLRGHTATLRGHTATLADHTERLTRLEAGQARLEAGVQTIIGLLDREIDTLE